MLSGGEDRDVLFGGLGDDELRGNGGRDNLFGDTGDDLLDGGARLDVLFGGDGADTLIGGDGDDKLFGGDGDDVLIADAGHDRLSGGSGGDLFVLGLEDLGGSIDQITDWDDGDRIIVRGLTDETLQAITAGQISDFLAVRQVGGDSFLQIDLDGTGSQHDLVNLVRLGGHALDLDDVSFDPASGLF